VPQSYYFCIKNALKVTYDHLCFTKKFLGSLSLAMKGRDNKGKKGSGEEGEGEREREGRERRKVKGLQPPNLELCPRPWAEAAIDA
jgi:hypothetical protein